MRFGSVPEGLDQRMFLERLLNDSALNTLAAAMNEAHLIEARFVCSVHVLFDNRFDVARCKGVQIERAFNRDAMGHEAV